VRVAPDVRQALDEVAKVKNLMDITISGNANVDALEIAR